MKWSRNYYNILYAEKHIRLGLLIMDDYKSDSSPMESVCEFYFTDRQNVYKKVFERYKAVFQKNIEDYFYPLSRLSV